MRTMPQAVMSSVEVASCILAHRMQRRILTEATGWRISMPAKGRSDEEPEDEEAEDALPWRGFGRELEGILV